ncbi:phosphatidylinositol 4-kinase alpha 1 [Quercus suber]|uniref:Phosphatidylinositol 4-kinase alpha 1 n=1 Tax=Quercus suber TaxID=58331 RepID=A0AAW0LEU3_QUESU
MEAMTELCDLVAQNPTQFSDKLSWICNGCPQPDSLLSGSPPRVSRSQLNAILAHQQWYRSFGQYHVTGPKRRRIKFSYFHRE